jgi:hypothetical protein
MKDVIVSSFCDRLGIAAGESNLIYAFPEWLVPGKLS